MGMRRPPAGAIALGGKDITGWGTRERREAGIGYIPEDRHRHGLLLDAPLWENRILGHQTRAPSVSGPGSTARGARKDTERIVDEYDVRTPGHRHHRARAVRRQPAEAHRRPRDERRPGAADRRPPDPRRRRRRPGGDLGPHRAARREGLAVLLISADLDELIGLSDRIQVILRGRLVGEFDPRRDPAGARLGDDRWRRRGARARSAS